MNLLPGREYSYEELARLTKSSVRAVAGRLFRARARLRRSDAADCTRHERADSHRQLESTTRSGCMNIYTPHAINVGTTFCLLLASAGLVSTCPPANTAGQRALLIERIMRPPKIGNVQEAEDKARAIDLLADERAAEAILPLIDCLSDTRALHGSDNWVGGHATNALEAIRHSTPNDESAPRT